MDSYCSTDSLPFETEEASPDSTVESPPGKQKPSRPLPSPSSHPPAKRSRRSVQKRVVSVPIAEADAARPNSKGCAGEGPPPSDSWAWRKYGQKPIKGSPYPRGYYRCSSSKGCPARKQVERSRADPTMLVVTYSFDHNHPWPLPKNHHHSSSSRSASRAAPEPPPPVQPETVNHREPVEPAEPEEEKFAGLIEPELMSMGDECFHLFGGVASTSDSILYAPVFGAIDVAPPEEHGGGEDDLFAGLGELPECAVVFGQRRGFGLASSTAPWCWTTG